MSNSALALFSVGYGLVFALFGYPVFRILLPVYGGIVGYAVGVTLIVPDYPLVALTVGIVLAIVFASISYFYWGMMVSIAGALLGYGLVAGMVLAFNPNATTASLLIGLAGAVAGFLVFLFSKDVMVMVASALNGAMLTAWGLHRWLDPTSTLLTHLTQITFVVVAVLGIVVQVRLFGKQHKYASSS